MFSPEEFRMWIEASHIYFELFEGRYDAYPLIIKWASEWLNTGSFEVTETDVEIIRILFGNFNYEAFLKENELYLKDTIRNQVDECLEEHIHEGNIQNIGIALMPFLFTWNFQRFKEYFKRNPNFSLKDYFLDLGKHIATVEDELRDFHSMHLLEDPIEKEKIRSVFKLVNRSLTTLGKSTYEPVGTIKLLHVFAPYYFPILDSRIARAFGIDRNQKDYIIWMNALRIWLRNYLEVIPELEEQFGLSILKLVDEGLYVMVSIKLKWRAPRLGLKVTKK